MAHSDISDAPIIRIHTHPKLVKAHRFTFSASSNPAQFQSPIRPWSLTLPCLRRVVCTESQSTLGFDSDYEYHSAVSSIRSSLVYMSVFGDDGEENEYAPLTDESWLTPTEDSATPTASTLLQPEVPTAANRRVTYGAVDIAPSYSPPKHWRENQASVTTPSSPAEVRYAQERRSATPTVRKRTPAQQPKVQKRSGPLGWINKKLKKQEPQPTRARSSTVGIGDRGVPAVDRGFAKSTPAISGFDFDADPEVQYQQQKEILAARGFPNTSPMVAGTKDFKLYSEYVKRK